MKFYRLFRSFRGRSLPCPFFTRSSGENVAVSPSRRASYPAIQDFIHSLLALILVGVAAGSTSAATLTNTAEANTVGIDIIKGPSNQHLAAEMFALLTDTTTTANIIRGVEAYTTGNQNDPSSLRIGIYGSTLYGYDTGLVYIEYDVPDLANKLVTFGVPDVNSLNAGVEKYWTATFHALGGDAAKTLVGSDNYWIVYSLDSVGGLSLETVTAQFETLPQYLSTAATADYDGSNLPTWALAYQGAIEATVEYTPVPEIDPASCGSAFALLMGSLGLVERRARPLLGRSTAA